MLRIQSPIDYSSRMEEEKINTWMNGGNNKYVNKNEPSYIPQKQKNSKKNTKKNLNFVKLETTFEKNKQKLSIVNNLRKNIKIEE